MSDLVVDYNLLDQAESTLSGLRGEFRDIQAQQHAYFGAWGSDAIASAMDDFAGNWDYHRKNCWNPWSRWARWSASASRVSPRPTPTWRTG